ncbi:MAG: IPTL-CTERM sorting domain-containing protein [Congregibacter sp.]
MSKVICAIVFIVTAFSSAASFSQDVTGSYRLEVIDTGPTACVWRGTTELVQSGGNPGTLGGSVNANQISGDSGCFSSFSGTITGTVNGSAITLGGASGALGSVSFVGTIAGASISGTWTGPGGLEGTYSMTATATAVPALPIWGLAILSMLLAAFAVRFDRSAGREVTGNSTN